MLFLNICNLLRSLIANKLSLACLKDAVKKSVTDGASNRTDSWNGSKKIERVIGSSEFARDWSKADMNCDWIDDGNQGRW